MDVSSATDSGLSAALLMRRHSLYQPPLTPTPTTGTSTAAATHRLTVTRTRHRSHSTSSIYSTAAEISKEIDIFADADNNRSSSAAASFLQYVDDQVHETWDQAKLAMIGAQRLLQYHELPKDWQENEYVLTGYRFYETHCDCLKSIFMLHNETLNIWSHLIGFLFFSYFSVSVFNHHFPEASASDRTIFATFCIAALKCLFCSSIYHTYVCHCKHKTIAATFDYIGIAFLIAASVLVTEYYGYYCQPVIGQRYMIFTSVVSSFGVVLPFFKVWDTKEFRPIRITFFLSLAFSSIVPVVHLFWLHGVAETYAFLEPAATSVAMYLLGVLFYANRFPERFFPGRFDFAGMTSHAIWHVFVCFGIYFHYLASLHFYKNRHDYSCPMPQ